MSAVDTKFYEKKKSSTFYVAISFLLFVIIWTIALGFYNSRLVEENASLSQRVSQIEGSIEELQSDENVQIYSIYDKHSSFLDELALQSDIPKFVSHLRKQFGIYGLESKGFNYSSWQATIDISAQTNDSGYAYEKIVKFLRAYKALEEGALFDVEFIQTLAGYDRINFSWKFTLK